MCVCVCIVFCARRDGHQSPHIVVVVHFFPFIFFLKILLKRLLKRLGKTTTKEKRDPDLVPKSIFPQSALYNRETMTTKKMKTSYLAGDECGEVSSRKQLVFVHAFDDVERCGDFRPLRRHGAVVEASQTVDFQRVQRFLEER